MQITQFHKAYYQILQGFAESQNQKLIVSVPPQHGKSYGASILLPAYLLGQNPDLKICIASYSFQLARKFGAAVQKLIETPEYQRIFPNTKLKGMAGAAKNGATQRTIEEFDIVGRKGGLKLVGREGSLTGNRVDVMILDDLYRDVMEANSPVIRKSVWEWYTTVVRTRLHNDSRELMVFTRWHQDDLIGQILRTEKEQWRAVNFEALKASPPTPLDPRKTGEPLWPQRHSRKLLLQRKKMDIGAFEALYQGNPAPVEGLLYGEFSEGEVSRDAVVVRRAAYIDTADSGADYLCAVAYVVTAEGLIYVQDVVYTQEPMEVSEGLCGAMIGALDVQVCYVESNNGGRGFARVLQRLAPRCKVESFHQSGNKIARITSNATELKRLLKMPPGWQRKWPEFHQHLVGMRREIAANKHDDAADTLTGIIEKECENKGCGVPKVKFSSARKRLARNY